MTFVYKNVEKDDVEYQKYADLEQRYINETPTDILKAHNYQYAHLGDKRYREIYSNVNRWLTVISDDERKIDLLMIHEDDADYNYCQTPNAWVLFFEHSMILINFYDDYDGGSLANGNEWYQRTYLVEPLVLPELVQSREEEIKQYLLEALTVYSESHHYGRIYLKLTKRADKIIFDQPYEFRGYNT